MEPPWRRYKKICVKNDCGKSPVKIMAAYATTLKWNWQHCQVAVCPGPAGFLLSPDHSPAMYLLRSCHARTLKRPRRKYKIVGGPRKLSDPLEKKGKQYGKSTQSQGVWGVLKIPAGIFMPPCLQEIRLITLPTCGGEDTVTGGVW